MRGLVIPILAITNKEGRSVYSWNYHLLWFPDKTFKLRKSIAWGMFLMSAVLRLCINLFFSSCTSQIPSSPILSSWIPQYCFVCITLCCTRVSKLHVLRDHSQTIQNGHWEYKIGYNSPILPRCQQARIQRGTTWLYL